MTNPSRFLLALFFAIVPLAGTRSQQSTIAPSANEVDIAIDRAVTFLLSQQKENGAITNGQYDTTMTALSIMALASVGVTPSQDDARGNAMRRGLDFVLGEDRQEKTGYFGNVDGSRMYGHGIITLMLSEMLGMGADASQDAKIRARCQKGIDLILTSQRQNKPVQFRGGWRYTPDAGDSDLSVSVWQVMALRSSKTDGMDVPSAAIESAVAYLKRSCTCPLDSKGNPTKTEAGFAYTPGANDIQFAMTAAGVLAMQVCGQYDSPLVKSAADWLQANPPKWGARYFFYGTYYFAQGMHQRGGDIGQAAETQVKEALLPKQKEDGGWTAEGEEGGATRIYATSMAILSLSVKYHYLPIYQR
jgi:hypothetical protein